MQVPDRQFTGALLKGYFLAGTAAVLSGLISIFGKLMIQYPGNSPVALMSVRASIAFAALAVGLLVLRRQDLRIVWRDVPFFALFGLVGVAGCFSLYLIALQHTSITTAIVIVYTFPAQVAVLAAVLLGERLNTRKLLALGAAIAGCLLVAQAYDLNSLRGNLTGILFSFAVSIALTLYNLLAKRTVVRYGAWTMTVYALGFGSLWMLLIATPSAIISLRLPADGWLILIAWALIPTVFGNVLYLSALKYIEVSATTIVSTLELVSAIGLACLFLGESIQGLQLLGAFLVVAAIGILRRGKRVTAEAPPLAPDQTDVQIAQMVS